MSWNSKTTSTEFLGEKNVLTEEAESKLIYYSYV